MDMSITTAVVSVLLGWSVCSVAETYIKSPDSRVFCYKKCDSRNFQSDIDFINCIQACKKSSDGEQTK